MVCADGMHPGPYGGMGLGTGQAQGAVGEGEGAVVVPLVSEDSAHLADQIDAGGQIAGLAGVGGGVAVVGCGVLGHAQVVGEEADEAAGVGGERGDLRLLGGCGGGVPGDDLLVVADGVGVYGGRSAQVVQSSVGCSEGDVGVHQVPAALRGRGERAH